MDSGPVKHLLSTSRCLTFLTHAAIVIGGMKVKFNKQVSVDFLDHREDSGADKTFYHNQIVEIDHLEETARGFVDLIFENGDAAIGVPKQSLTVL